MLYSGEKCVFLGWSSSKTVNLSREGGVEPKGFVFGYMFEYVFGFFRYFLVFVFCFEKQHAIETNHE